jgi:hypothetical protein
VPEPRHAGPDQVEPHPLDTRSPIGPRSGVELPPLPTGAYGVEPPYPAEPPYPTEPPYLAGPAPGIGEATGEHHTQPIDRAALRRSTEATGPVPTPSQTVYKTRRAGVFGLVGGVAAVAELFLVRVLLAGEFGHTVAPGAVLGALFAMTGIPLVAIGGYALITGPVAAGPEVVRAWLRTPLAYLPIGLILLIAAGLAAG